MQSLPARSCRSEATKRAPAPKAGLNAPSPRARWPLPEQSPYADASKELGSSPSPSPAPAPAPSPRRA